MTDVETTGSDLHDGFIDIDGHRSTVLLEIGRGEDTGGENSENGEGKSEERI